jgi:hypothetical protein
MGNEGVAYSAAQSRGRLSAHFKVYGLTLVLAVVEDTEEL